MLHSCSSWSNSLTNRLTYGVKYSWRLLFLNNKGNEWQHLLLIKEDLKPLILALKMESELIVDRPAIQNLQWLNYTLQLIPKQVLNMTEFNWKCEKLKITAYFFFKSYKPLAPLFSKQWIFMNDIGLSIVLPGSSLVVHTYTLWLYVTYCYCICGFYTVRARQVLITLFTVIRHVLCNTCCQLIGSFKRSWIMKETTKLGGNFQYEHVSLKQPVNHVSSANYSLIFKYMCMRN